MNEKKLEKLDHDALDFTYDEFESMLQEFIDSEFDSTENNDTAFDATENNDAEYDADDDNDAETTDEVQDDPIRQKSQLIKKSGMEAGRRVLPFDLSLSILENSEKNGFTDGPATVRVTTKDEVLPSPERFTFHIYTADYYLMCSSETDCSVSRNDSELTYEIPCSNIWLPGLYYLLIKDGSYASLKMEFIIDDHLGVLYEAARYNNDFDRDDALTIALHSSGHWQLMAILPGTRQMRLKLLEQERASLYNEMRKELGAEPLKRNCNYLFCTHNKDWDEQLLISFRSQLGVQSSLEYVDCSVLYDAACNNPYENLNEMLLSASGCVFCLTNLSALLSTGGKVIMKRILDEVRQPSQPLPLWLCGSRPEINSLLEQFPSIKEFYTSESWIEQERFTDFEMIQTVFRLLREEHLEPTEELKDRLSQTIIDGYRQGRVPSLAISDLRRIIADQIRPRYLKRSLECLHVDGIQQLSLEDVDCSLFLGNGDSFDDCMTELNEMVGLDEVKQGITTLANNTRFFLKRRRLGLPTSGNIAYHAIFTGNPGTGKTTVARKIGRIYRSLGLLSKGDVIAVDRTRLVGRYIGETEENMKSVLEEARGNVLFIDEAYNLSTGAEDRKDFGARVIDSLLTVLSQPNPDMMVIFAGYEKEMDAMLNTNPGLTGRFPYKYRFADYNADQLLEIALRLLQRDAYILTDGAAAQLRDAIAQTYSSRTSNFGNARWVEQFVRNGIIPAMSDRLVSTGCDDYQRIEVSDILKAYEKFNPKATELKPRRKVGFNA